MERRQPDHHVSEYNTSFQGARGKAAKPVTKGEEGCPTIKMERRQPNHQVSEYNSSFQGAGGKAGRPVTKYCSVVMGDPAKILERGTTYNRSFNRPIHSSQPVLKENLKFKCLNPSKETWSTTTRQTFREYKMGEPVVHIKQNKNSSSVFKGETDKSGNKDRKSVTTNRVSFPDLSHSIHPVSVPGPGLRTKSHVHFNPPHLSGLYFKTTAQEHYGRKGGKQARPAIQWPSDILSGSGKGESLSITKTDYPNPLIARKRTPCVSQHRSAIKPPMTKHFFSTTHGETYRAKPLFLQSPSCSQFVSHFAIN